MFFKFGFILLMTLSTLSLTGCSNDKEQQTITEQSKMISSLQSENRSLERDLADIQAVKKGETVELFGTIEIGRDLEPGEYHVTLPDNDPGSFKLFKNEIAESNDKFTVESLNPATEEQEADALSNYKLEKGNILVLEGKLNFTRTR